MGLMNLALHRNDTELCEMPLILSVGNYTGGKILGKRLGKEECLAVGTLKIAECW